MTSIKLSRAQYNVMRDVITLPARYRHNNRAGGWLKMRHTEVFDGRTFSSLSREGLLEISEHGVRASSKGRLSVEDGPDGRKSYYWVPEQTDVAAAGPSA